MSVLCAADIQPAPDILGEKAIKTSIPIETTEPKDNCSDDGEESDDKKPTIPLRFRQLPASFWQEPRPKSMFCQIDQSCPYSLSPFQWVPTPAAPGIQLQGSSCSLCSSNASCPPDTRTHQRPPYPYWPYRQCPCHRTEPGLASQRFAHLDSAGTLMYLPQGGCPHPSGSAFQPSHITQTRLPEVFPQDIRFHPAGAAVCDQPYSLLSRMYHYRRSARYHPLL